MAKAIAIHDGDARRAVAQSPAISTREKSHASSATLTASLAAITITRRVMDVVEDSADIQEKGGRNCTMVSCENHAAVRSRAPGSGPSGPPLTGLHYPLG